MNIEHTKSKIRKEKMRLKKLPASIQLNTEPLYAIIMSRKSFRIEFTLYILPECQGTPHGTNQEKSSDTQIIY